MCFIYRMRYDLNYLSEVSTLKADQHEAEGWRTLTCQDAVWEVPTVGIRVWSQVERVVWLSGTLLHQGHLEASKPQWVSTLLPGCV